MENDGIESVAVTIRLADGREFTASGPRTRFALDNLYRRLSQEWPSPLEQGGVSADGPEAATMQHLWNILLRLTMGFAALEGKRLFEGRGPSPDLPEDRGFLDEPDDDWGPGASP